jgi:hypothetical protein
MTRVRSTAQSFGKVAFVHPEEYCVYCYLKRLQLNKKLYLLFVASRSAWLMVEG